MPQPAENIPFLWEFSAKTMVPAPGGACPSPTVYNDHLTDQSEIAGQLVFVQTKAFSLRRRCPEGADEVEKVTISPEFS